MKLTRIVTALAVSLTLLLPSAALAAAPEDILVKDSAGNLVYSGTFLNVLGKTQGTLGQDFADKYEDTPYTYGVPGPVTIYEVAPGEIFRSDILSPPNVVPLKVEADGALYWDASKQNTDYYSGYVDEIEGLVGFSITEEGYYFLHPDDPTYLGNELVFIFHVTNGQGETQPEESFAGFTDVKADDYFAQAVQWAVEAEITAGTSATTFSPDTDCTTAQILTFLWRANGSPVPAGSSPSVPAGQYYSDAANWALEQGLMDAFNPDAPATRSATVTYLWKLAGKPAVDAAAFTDVDAGAEYAQAVAWAVQEGITAGTSATTFSPDNTCTRGQIMTFLYRDLAQ